MIERESIGIGIVFSLVTVLFMCFSPDTLTIIITAIMAIVVALGYWYGITKIFHYAAAFRVATDQIKKAKNVSTNSLWLAISQLDNLFQDRELDKIFLDFKYEYDRRSKNNEPFGLEDIINVDMLQIKTWQGPVSQIPGTLTGIGLIGTFVGLLIGIGNIGFSSVVAATASLQLLLGGIKTAFYTSIAGVVLSIMFNLIYRIAWSKMLHSLSTFYMEFHQYILPSVEQQTRKLDLDFQRRVLKSLEHNEREIDDNEMVKEQ